MRWNMSIFLERERGESWANDMEWSFGTFSCRAFDKCLLAGASKRFIETTHEKKKVWGVDVSGKKLPHQK